MTPSSSSSSKTKWPNSARAAISLTLDNMGEAADLTRNLWPPHLPIGSHPSVTHALPRMLSILAAHDVHVTYFTEAWNVDVYPEALKGLVQRGHEVAWHAWRHEAWAKLEGKDERENFKRSFEKVREVEGEGVRKYRGFRPPGGIINEGTLALCVDYGLKYLSPAATDAGIVDVVHQNRNSDPSTTPPSPPSQIVILPFKWPTVDAYYYLPSFTGLRALKHEPNPSTLLSPPTLKQRYMSEIDSTISSGAFLAPLFHPFLMIRSTDGNNGSEVLVDEERMHVFEEVVEYLARKRDDGEIWLAKCEEVEEWVREKKEGFGAEDVGWDSSSWR